MSIAENIKARQDAEALIELAGEQPLRFWETLKQQTQIKIDIINPPQLAIDNTIMPDDELGRFENTYMMPGWSQYAGNSVGQVAETDIGYLHFLNGESEFNKKLKRYLNTPTIKKRYGY